MTETGFAVDRRASDSPGDALGWSAVGVGAVGLVAVASQRVIGVGPSACAARTLLGIPCPVCGLSTVATDLAHGEVVATVGNDVLGVAFLLVVAVLAGLQIGRLAGVSRWRPPTMPAAWVAGGLLVSHWLATLTGVVSLPPLS